MKRNILERGMEVIYGKPKRMGARKKKATCPKHQKTTLHYKEGEEQGFCPTCQAWYDVDTGAEYITPYWPED